MKYWWVIQELRGVFTALGPYRSKEAAENRYEKTFGGEVTLHDSWEKDPLRVIEEFKLEGV